MERLSVEQIQVLTWIEEWWHRKGNFPSVGAITSKWPDFDISAALNHETFRLGLMNRGIDAPVGISGVPAGLSKEQVAAIIAVVSFDDKRSVAAKLKDMGISITKWNGWLKNPYFKDYLQDLSTANFQDAVHQAHDGLLQAVSRGDTHAIKFYFEVTGRHTQDTPQLQNIRLVVARLIESIQRHVTDPAALRAINADFELVLRGDGLPEQPKQLGVTI